MSTPWRLSLTTESQKLAASSPSWQNLAGTGGVEYDRRSRSERAKKRRLFGDTPSPTKSYQLYS